ncbi:MAG: hypothetical protein ACRBHB_19620 [Arenicella sp.]
MKHIHIVFTAFLLNALFSFSTMAQSETRNKVVVIPLDGSGVSESSIQNLITKAMAPNYVWRGEVNANGVKDSPGLFSSNNPSIGLYNISIDAGDLEAVGLDRSELSGFMLPVLTLVNGNAGDTIHSSVQSRAGDSVGVSSYGISVIILDKDGNRKNNDFIFHTMLYELQGMVHPTSAADQQQQSLSKHFNEQCIDHGDSTYTCTKSD